MGRTLGSRNRKNRGPRNLGGGNENIAGNNTDANNSNSKTESIADLGAIDPSAVDAGFTDPVQGPQTPESTIEPSTGETVAAPRRGRPPGSSTKSRLNISGVETCLLGIHQTLSFAFGVPEIAMNEPEAKQLAEAYANVAQHYPVLQLPDKQLALVNFGSTLAIIYGAKYAAYKMRVAMSRPHVVQPIRQQPVRTTGTGATTNPPPNEFVAPAGQPANGVDLTQKTATPVPLELRTGTIPGVPGEVVFPEDHPLGATTQKH
jgi:hypothetical protein